MCDKYTLVNFGLSYECPNFVNVAKESKRGFLHHVPSQPLVFTSMLGFMHHNWKNYDAVEN